MSKTRIQFKDDYIKLKGEDFYATLAYSETPVLDVAPEFIEPDMIENVGANPHSLYVKKQFNVLIGKLEELKEKEVKLSKNLNGTIFVNSDGDLEDHYYAHASLSFNIPSGTKEVYITQSEEANIAKALLDLQHSIEIIFNDFYRSIQRTGDGSINPKFLELLK